MLFYRCYLSKNRPDHFGSLGCNPAVKFVLCHAWIQCLLYVSYRVYTLYLDVSTCHAEHSAVRVLAIIWSPM